MNRYDVHIYALVRVQMEGSEATSQREAIDVARKRFDEEGMAERLGLLRPTHAAYAHYADEIIGYLVDEQGDEEHCRSQWYDFEHDEKGGTDGS